MAVGESTQHFLVIHKKHINQYEKGIFTKSHQKTNSS
jgi:hypothetical protein